MCDCYAADGGDVILLWVVKVGKKKCMVEHFSTAWDDWKTHDGFRLIYPKIMTISSFYKLKEFDGW
jgi:hypothetical protein